MMGCGALSAWVLKLFSAELPKGRWQVPHGAESLVLLVLGPVLSRLWLENVVTKHCFSWKLDICGFLSHELEKHFLYIKFLSVFESIFIFTLFPLTFSLLL